MESVPMKRKKGAGDIPTIQTPQSPKDGMTRIRRDLQAEAKNIGLPASGPTEKIARLLDIVKTEPANWSREDFNEIAPHLAIHQDVRSGSASRVQSISENGLNSGMVDSLDALNGKRWSWAGRLYGGDAYLFISGGLRYKGKDNPYLRPGNKPLIHFKSQPGQDIFEAITSTGKIVNPSLNNSAPRDG